MSALPPDRVYQGLWIDYSQGPVLGATITTTGAKANIVIAILSLLVAFSGAHLWDLIAFVGYCTGTSEKESPAYHQQRQFLARNLTSPGSFTLEMIKVGWAWRKSRPWSCLVMMGLLALICSAGFMAAGIFVSLVVNNVGIQVLVQSPSCGFLSWLNESTPLQREYQQRLLSQASIYSEACYNTTDRLSQCNIYNQPNIPIQAATDVECPFADLCKTPSALRLDTGLLVSDTTFGINAPSSSRVQMQRAVTCAPINESSFFASRPFPANILHKYENREPFKDEYVLEWFMGLITAEDRPLNSTFWMSNYTSRFSVGYDLTPRVCYALVTSTDSPKWHNSTFTPISSLFSNSTIPESADIHILAVQNDGVRFWAPSDDPLFASHKKTYIFFDDNSNLTMYCGDRPASFLGCLEQFKFCFSAAKSSQSQDSWCTSLAGLDQAYDQALQYSQGPDSVVSAEQKATLHNLFMLTPSWYWLTRTPMQVTKSSTSFQLGVPDNQWQVEMYAWMDYLLSISQSSITHLAAGPGILEAKFDELLANVTSQEDKILCHSQKMGAPDGYSNINFLGFIIVVAASAIIMLLNMSLVPLLKYAHQVSRGRLFPRVKLWAEDGMLQAHRKAYEGMGYDNWTVEKLGGEQAETEGWIPMKSVPVYEGAGRQGAMLPSLAGGLRTADADA
ncbi:hypothetical protein QBC37DRAFT_459763 [Rhypophila decipiens]|uniref:Uncharacterized protein n=1 Tax=Rhypophila decipiens TaxID=261697 RepID=A0AAN7AYQ3_9PEZI|nr:hypothetical protein QBC37DRAFT_459763 [Rhypophila decipiens]